ncbi:MAG: hypothetical protein KF842_06395 [Caulobacter sp.]|nr:hypothetical protein [Caulobacter sp.]
MTYAAKLILVLPLSTPDALEPFVETCLADGVELICISGPGCDAVEDEIDALIVGDGADDARFIATTSHGDEPLEDVINLATLWIGDRPAGEAPQLVRL